MYQVFPETIPAELKPGRVWVCHDRDKVPTVATERDRRAKSTDPATWCSFEEALDAYLAGWHAGIGRVIVWGEGLVGVDLDHCRDATTGAINPRAREILERLDSYSEVSPSGTGVKVWLRANLDKARIKPGLEVYPRGRYFTTTGQILSQHAANIEERSRALAEVIASEFPASLAKPERYPGSARTRGRGARRSLDLNNFIEAAAVEWLAEVADIEAEVKHKILCPWIEEHTTNPESGTFVGQYSSGATFFHCYHAHCAGRRWGDFVRAVAPNIKTIRVAPRGCYGAYLEVTVSDG